MSSKDVLKVFVMLAVAVSAVALYCYARVDLSMSLEEVNHNLEQWVGKASMLSMLIWSQLAVVGLAWLGYRIWRHHAETARAK